MAVRMELWFCIFLVSLLSKVSRVQLCHVTDRMALKYFEQEIVFAGEDFKTWQDSTDCCCWEGVTCNTEGRVESLHLLTKNAPPPHPHCSSRIYLAGTSLGGLSELVNLTLKNVALNGALPRAWGNLHKLKVLDIENCNVVGNFPREFCCQWSNIKTIILKDNSLNGSIPTCLTSELALTVLDLSGNNFTEAIPSNDSKFP